MDSLSVDTVVKELMSKSGMCLNIFVLNVG